MQSQALLQGPEPPCGQASHRVARAFVGRDHSGPLACLPQFPGQFLEVLAGIDLGSRENLEHLLEAELDLAPQYETALWDYLVRAAEKSSASRQSVANEES